MGNHKIFIFGLDRAGKTLITNYLTKGIIDNNTKPSLSFNQSILTTQKLKIAVWDTPGQIKLRKMWLDKVVNSEVLLFVLDTSDALRFDEAKMELTNFIKGLYNYKAPIVFLFHKLDTPQGQANLAKAKELFNLSQITIQQVIPMETNKENPASLDAVREKVNELLLQIEADGGL